MNLNKQSRNSTASFGLFDRKDVDFVCLSAYKGWISSNSTPAMLSSR